MKINIANPRRGLLKTIKIESPNNMKFFDMMIGDTFKGTLISDEYADFDFEIRGGNDHEGVPMCNKYRTTKLVKPLLKKGDLGYRCKRKGVRRRKCIRGCIVSDAISALNCVVIKESENTIIENINDKVMEQNHLPKRADKLMKMFSIDKCEDLYNEIWPILKGSGATKLPRLRITRLDQKEKARKLEEKKEARKQKQKELAKEFEAYKKKFAEFIY